MVLDGIGMVLDGIGSDWVVLDGTGNLTEPSVCCRVCLAEASFSSSEKTPTPPSRFLRISNLQKRIEKPSQNIANPKRFPKNNLLAIGS